MNHKLYAFVTCVLKTQADYYAINSNFPYKVRFNTKEKENMRSQNDISSTRHKSHHRNRIPTPISIT